MFVISSAVVSKFKGAGRLQTWGNQRQSDKKASARRLSSERAEYSRSEKAGQHRPLSREAGPAYSPVTAKKPEAWRVERKGQ